ncbi:uncharacterized protein LOC8282035 isoform X1 [Ricinus communis]|uniref:uncharacterized protein LOC8282035 isoform X1 n=2 Tax=Ricinus communis TaxID=3988 RepID=UPI00201AD47C|nr:uncharacterized protein LOC8282035 isoform X1 [Ricinus communis]
MEIELEPRVKPLSYKVKGMSRESPSQKASHILDTDLRSHWSTGTNTKEWILLELDEPCLLSHLRIYNKSVLEWEISVGLRYKPETFVKVRPRCEAPRRDMIYPMNYTPCRYVRISCLRGNPIAIFFIQLIGVSVTGLEPEFQPVVNHLLPNIISHKQDASDMHLQLLQDMTDRLLVFLPQLEADLTSFSDAADQNLRFLAMLVGPLYPILHIVHERETARSLGGISESEVPKNCQPVSSLTVSSNFEPRRSRSTSPTSSSMVFRPDAIFILLRKAFRDSDLGAVCRMASRILYKLIDPVPVQEGSSTGSEVTSALDETSKFEVLNPVHLANYSSLLGEEFQIPDDHWDSSILNVLDIGAVEEGILHVLYACASQPLLCRKLAESASEFWSALPLVQALLPALRPFVSNLGENVDDIFSQWKQPFVQQALSQIVAMSCSAMYRPLLHACAGYLSSYSPSHAKAACVLIDLCSSVLGPWMAQIIAKIDLTMELLEDLLGTIQGARYSPAHARAALKYIVLALSGHMDDILGKYKEVKHKILFLLEMLEPFLDPAIYALRNTIAFGDVSFTFVEKQEETCVVALNVIRTAVQKPGVLSSLESEWRRGSVAPSVLLAILEPHMQLPPEIDFCKSPIPKSFEHDSSAALHSSVLRHPGTTSKSNGRDDSDGKVDISDNGAKMDMFEDVSLLFAPTELRTIVLANVSGSPNEHNLDLKCKDANLDLKNVIEKKVTDLFPDGLVLDAGFTAEYFNLQADFFQLITYHDCELKASEFQRLALDLHSQNEIAIEGHDAAIDALLLAAECYVNPFFMMSFKSNPQLTSPLDITETRRTKIYEVPELGNASKRNGFDLETITLLEKKRDKVVLQLLLEAAELDRKFQKSTLDGENIPEYSEEIDDQVIKLSSLDVHSADAITMVRQNQALLCSFLIWRLKKEQHLMHEILMHCLVFLLHSATRLYCAPEEVIDIILGSAEYLNAMLTSFYYQFKEGNLQLDPEKIHEVQRRWALLQNLVIASSGGEVSYFSVDVNNRSRCGSLIPPSAWLQRVSTFSRSSFPLVRFLGWMAISRNAEQYIKEQLFLTSDLSQLTCLLSIFVDELAAVDNVTEKEQEDMKIEQLGVGRDSSIHKGFDFSVQQHRDQTFHAIYPDLNKFFPNLKKQFEVFGEHILQAVGLQLRSLSSTVVPDILCWFSDLCLWNFLQTNHNTSQNGFVNVRGYVAKNAKAIILYILEAIVIEHMVALVPEMPRVVQVLVSLCRASYCDVLFLESIMRLLKPLISYSFCKVSDEEKILVDDSCLNFESLCFEELFADIRQKNDNGDMAAEKEYSRALTIYVLASVFCDLSPQRRREILDSLILWTDFTAFEPTTSFHDYLCAFQTLMESCKALLLQTLRVFSVLPLQLAHGSDINARSLPNNSLEMYSSFLSEVCQNSCPPKNCEKIESYSFVGVVSKQKDEYLSAEEIEDFSKGLEKIIAKLNTTIELCWNLHPRLAKKLAITSAECFVFSRCLSSIAPQIQNAEEDSSENSFPFKSVEEFPVHWKIGIEGLAETIMKLQENRCWEVASLELDCLLGLPYCFWLDNVIDTICCVIKFFSCSAPKIAWRLQSDKWLTMLFGRGIHSLHESDGPLIDLFVTLLGHSEPEQRFVALKHLGRLVGQDVNREAVLGSKTISSNLLSPGIVVLVPEPFLSLLISSTWDQVVLLASSDILLPLRIHAMALLVSYVPFAARHQLQSFLAAADSVLHVLGKIVHQTCEGPLLRLSLALIAGACLYSSIEDISLIPQEVWRNIETLALSRTGSKVGDLEKSACEVLCRLRNEEDDAKEALKEVFSSSSSNQIDSEFGSTRDAILQILANLTSVHSYFEIFSEKIDKEAMELEEAELELDIVQKENALEESLKYTEEKRQSSWLTASGKHGSRLQEIKEHIHSLDKSKIREHIVARRQKKLLMRRDRQKYLEEAALREEELLRELDRERTSEAEKEIERQRLLELERAKTRDLRHNLDMEKERQTQRELQRELEQAESGLRSSRRDFSSSTHSRARDRFRERDNGRPNNEGSARSNSGSLQAETSTSSSMSMPAVVLSGSRSFSGQPPTILQSCDRSDECGISYEENFDGSKDSGDTGSVGDPDLMSAFDGQSGGFGPAQRHGSRGSKSRQVMERRERDGGRREGKWERKHS